MTPERALDLLGWTHHHGKGVRKIMKRVIRWTLVSCIMVIGVVGLVRGAGLAAAPKSGAVQLFNGQDLTGFDTFLQKKGKNNDPDKVFTVNDGVIHVSGKEYGYFITQKEYENYDLAVEFKWGEATRPPRKDKARDSGILYHVTGPDKIWPESVEFQMIEGGTGDLILVGGASMDYSAAVAGRAVGAKLSDDGKRYLSGRIDRLNKGDWKDVVGYRNANEVEHAHGEWNTLELIADGDTYTYKVNGKLVNQGTGLRPRKGKILFQSEGAELFFRKIELRPLEK